MRTSILCLLALSCGNSTSSKPSEPPVVPAPGAARSQDAVIPGPLAASASETAASTEPWIWHHDANYQAWHWQRWDGDEVQVKTHAAKQITTIVREGKAGWTVIRPFEDGQVVASIVLGDALVLAEHSPIASGCKLSALNAADGSLRWSKTLTGIGPQRHSEYSNQVQLRLRDDGGITVYGRESHGAYIEVVSAKTGETERNLRPDTALTDVEWRWQPPARNHFRAGAEDVGVPGGVLHFAGTDAPDTADAIEHRDSAGKLLWRSELSPEGGCGAATMRVFGGRAIVVHYCSIATGARVHSLDLKTGLATTEAQTLFAGGPISHSKYWNDVELGEHNGLIAVYGSEASRRYIELVDPTDLQTLAWTTFDPE